MKELNLKHCLKFKLMNCIFKVSIRMFLKLIVSSIIDFIGELFERINFFPYSELCIFHITKITNSLSEKFFSNIYYYFYNSNTDP